jgi:hypothetical protein
MEQVFHSSKTSKKEIQNGLLKASRMFLILLKTTSLLILSAFYFYELPAQESHTVKVKESNKIVTIENYLLKVDYDLSSGTFSVSDKREPQPCITEAFSKVNMLKSNDLFMRHTWRENNFSDDLGSGKVLIINSSSVSLLFPDIVLQIYIYSDKGYLVFKEGVENNTPYHINITSMHPMIGKAFEGYDFTGLKILDGNSGGAETRVRTINELSCQNNIMARFGKGKSVKVIVMGGLTYYEFEKYFSISIQQNHLLLSMRNSDPVGKRVEAGSKYFSDEKVFLNVTDPDPFDALEEYGLALRASQKINLNIYNFPTVCLWYASHYLYGGGPLINDTRGGVWEMDNVVKSGFMKYSPVAIRIVPDYYQPDNQQGWWDDEHWQMYGDDREYATIGPHYKIPYETSKKFGDAITERGGIPISYSQTARRSEDYCLKYPGHMLFNNPQRMIGKPEYKDRWSNDFMWSYDFTDPGFVEHMQNVYANMKAAGFKGIMFDYPRRTGWAYEGGFEDIYATTTSAYRDIFRLAKEGLGKDSYIDENTSGNDVTLGLIASQRIWSDCSIINPAMIARGGLRWYKNRVVVNYDMDSKIPEKALPAGSDDGYRSMFTMLYHTSGRVLLGSSFSKISEKQIYALSRLYPFHSSPKSARPLDAFSGNRFPGVYDFKVDSKWHQLIFYNSAVDTSVTSEKDLLKGNIKYMPSVLGVDLSEEQASGGLGLDPSKEYYIYDFWNEKFIGKVSGSGRFEQILRPNEARVMSVHEVENHPQFISTNRHIMQGFVDISDYQWDSKRNQLSAKSMVTGGESYRVVIAANGYRNIRSSVSAGTSTIKELGQELLELTINVPENNTVDWRIDFSK